LFAVAELDREIAGNCMESRERAVSAKVRIPQVGKSGRDSSGDDCTVATSVVAGLRDGNRNQTFFGAVLQSTLISIEFSSLARTVLMAMNEQQHGPRTVARLFRRDVLDSAWRGWMLR
jgi:hypothetical protein